MSDTDIYKNRERMPISSKNPRRYGKGRKCRSSAESKRSFDDQSGRKRRSKNAGFRRFLHLYRKKESERIFWWVMGTILVGLLIGAGIWQFYVNPQRAKDQQRQHEALRESLLTPAKTPAE